MNEYQERIKEEERREFEANVVIKAEGQYLMKRQPIRFES